MRDQRAAAHDELARDPHLYLRRTASEPAADPLDVHLPVESFGEDDEGRVELMQMPAQPLLDPAAFVDEVFAVIDQELQLPVGLLVRPRTAQTRLAQRGPRDRQRVDRVRLATRPARTPLGRHQLRRHPHQLLAGSDQLPLKAARQLPAILDRPQPLAIKPHSPRHQLVLRAATVCSSSIRPASSTATAVNDCLCTSTPITIIQIASSDNGGDRRADRPQSRQQPSSYQVTLDGLGTAAATQRWQVSLTRRHAEMESAAADPSLLRAPDATTTRRE